MFVCRFGLFLLRRTLLRSRRSRGREFTPVRDLAQTDFTAERVVMERRMVGHQVPIHNNGMVIGGGSASDLAHVKAVEDDTAGKEE